MAIDITREHPLSLTEATKVLPPIDGRRVSSSTIFRWIRRGLRGIRLDSARCGHRLCTSAEALHRFFAAVSEADQTAAPRTSTPVVRNPKHRSPAERARDVAASRKRLASMGI